MRKEGGGLTAWAITYRVWLSYERVSRTVSRDARWFAAAQALPKTREKIVSTCLV